MNRDYSNYAKLIIKQGINLKKGELLAIASPVLAAPLAEAVAEEEKEFHSKKEQKNKSAIDETYDIDEINRRAMLNDNYDI